MKLASIKDKMTSEDGLLSRRVRIGTYSAFLSLAVIATVVVINLIIGKLPTTYTKFDTSSQGVYTLTEATEELVKNVGEDVTVYLVSETGQENDTVLEFLNRYAAVNSRIKVVQKDPVSNPTFVMKYTEEVLDSNSVIVESYRRSTVIPFADIVVEGQYYDDNYQLVSYNYFNGESRITGAIQYVTSDTVPKLYLLTGHGETALDEMLLKYVRDDNVDVAELNLLATENAIPADASCVLIHAPTTDLAHEEANALITFMKNGGRVILTRSSGAAAFANLDRLTEYYGLTFQNGYVFETDPEHYLNYTYYLLPSVEQSGVSDVAGAEENSLYVFMPYAAGLTADKVPDGVTLTPLLTSSSGSYLKPYESQSETTARDDGDLGGPFYLGVMMSETSDTGKTGGLTVFTSPYVANSQADYMSGGGNSSFFVAAVDYLCGKDVSVSIAAKSMQVEALVVPSLDVTFWSILLIAVIPLTFLAIGLVIWYKRKVR